uniref:Uncharacterized protein n=1 Tax=Tanacetum cinerariifolium TaxID=118510 RepID=A0A6L2KHW5_TANCI|nr:hypothetical protein [Tanacetum cinerariifolium]
MLLFCEPDTSYGLHLIRRISDELALAVEIDFTCPLENKSSSGELDSTRPDVSKSLLFERNTLSGFSKGQYAVLIIQNMPYCLEEHIRCLDYRDQYAVLSGKADTLYPSGGYGVSVDLSEQDT